MSENKSDQKLLLIAGDYDLVEQIESSLGYGFFPLKVAFNHRDALYILATEQFDLMLVDTHMTDRHSGDVTYKTIQAKYPELPCLAIAINHENLKSLVFPETYLITNLDSQQIRSKVMNALSANKQTKGDSSYFAHMNRALERRVEEIETLFSVSQSLTEVLDLNEVLNRVVESARSLTQAEAGMILMPEDNVLVLKAWAGIDEETAQQFRIRSGDTVAWRVFNGGRSALIGAGEPQKIKTEYLVKSLLYVPILLKGEPIGVLGVNNLNKEDEFEAYQQDLLLNLGSYAAIAIENARIHEDSLHRARELQTIVSASETFGSTLSLEKTYQHIGQALGQALNVHHVELFDWDQSKSVLKTRTRYQQAIWDIKGGSRIDLTSSSGKVLEIQLKDEKQIWQDISAQDEMYQGAKRMLSLPIRAGKKILGVVQALYVKSTTSITLDDDVIKQINKRAVDILSNIQNQSVVERQATNFKFTHDLIELTQADWGRVAIYHKSESKLEILVEAGHGVWLNEHAPTMELENHPDLITSLKSKSTINVRSAFDTLPSGVMAMLRWLNGHAMLGLPLLRGNDLQGLVVFADTLNNRNFLKPEIDVARTILAHASTALENANLVRDLEKSLAELRETQEKLVQTARLTAMGELAAIVAHQINNPLTTIIVDAQLVLSREAKNSKNIKSLQSIIRAGKRTASVAKRLLTIARPDNPDADLEPVDVVETLNGVVTLVKTHIERSGIEVSLHMTKNKVPPVMAVRGQLDDVWLNLLMNAHDALQGQADAKIDVFLDYDAKTKKITVVVQDNGNGIPEAIQEHIFESFFTTKSADEGTGLGLYICRQAVERCQGTIRVESEVSLGTRFIVELPIIAETKDQPEAIHA